jgi:hypothetical protein
MSMTRLWRDQGRREAARGLLAPVYGWFTEGFYMLDLKERRRCWRSWHDKAPERALAGYRLVLKIIGFHSTTFGLTSMPILHSVD